VQIESVAGVEAAAAIAAAEGVDALVVGCADLSLSLGERPGVDSPRLQEAVGRVRRAARGAGVAFGIAGGADGSAGDGADLVLHSVDVRLYARGADVAATSVRRSIA
ncbi:MAG: aldolase/citrate lyase family protein, partial [Solirubrobacteraceae bacterium]